MEVEAEAGPGHELAGLPGGRPSRATGQRGRMDLGGGHPPSVRHLRELVFRWYLEGIFTPARRRGARHLGEALMFASVGRLDQKCPLQA